MKKALSYSVACRFEGMLRRVLHALAEEACNATHARAAAAMADRRPVKHPRLDRCLCGVSLS